MVCRSVVVTLVVKRYRTTRKLFVYNAFFVLNVLPPTLKAMRSNRTGRTTETPCKSLIYKGFFMLKYQHIIPVLHLLSILLGCKTGCSFKAVDMVRYFARYECCCIIHSRGEPIALPLLYEITKSIGPVDKVGFSSRKG